MPGPPPSPKPLHRRLLGPPYRALRRRLWRLHPRRIAALGGWLAASLMEIRRRRREPRVTVAVDINPFWEQLTGVGWYLHQVLTHLADRPDLSLRLYGPDLVASDDLPPPVVAIPTGPALERVRYSPPPGTAIHEHRLVRWLRRLEPWLLAADRNRVLFAPNFVPPRRFEAARLTSPLVATVHDLAFRHLAWTVDERTLAELGPRLDRTVFEAARVITPSEAVRAELLALELAPPERVRAIHHGPGQRAAQGSAQPGPSSSPAAVPGPFALFVGTLEPRKNLPVLLDAWRRARRDGKGGGDGPGLPPLVLAGRLGWKSEDLEARLRQGEAEGWLRRLGYVPTPELAALYREAWAFCFPSRYEGFGLPLLEAAAAGTPVVASDLPVLREVAGDAALYAPADRPDLWARELLRLAGDPDLHRRLSEAGRRRAESFRWDRSADHHARLLGEAAR